VLLSFEETDAIVSSLQVKKVHKMAADAANGVALSLDQGPTNGCPGIPESSQFQDGLKLPVFPSESSAKNHSPGR
jgi:hypothetical protein